MPLWQSTSLPVPDRAKQASPDTPSLAQQSQTYGLSPQESQLWLYLSPPQSFKSGHAAPQFLARYHVLGQFHAPASKLNLASEPVPSAPDPTPQALPLGQQLVLSQCQCPRHALPPRHLPTGLFHQNLLHPSPNDTVPPDLGMQHHHFWLCLSLHLCVGFLAPPISLVASGDPATSTSRSA